MKKLLGFLIENIVDKPSEVEISEKAENGQVVLNLKVAQEDMGKVIGKNGKVIRALRNVLKIKAVKQKEKVYLQLEETPQNV